MLKEKSLKEWVSFLCLFFLPAICFSQVLNGSFELEGQPSLAHWSFSCKDGTSFQDAPQDGGTWCLKLPIGNLQGCFPETAEQIISDFGNGDIVRLTAWARQDQDRSSPTSIYLKIVDATGKVTALASDTTTSDAWTQLSVLDTLSLQEGDSLAVVLDAGVTSGPQHLNSYSYFDLVEVQKVGRMVTSTGDAGDPHPREFKLFQNYPNPFNPETTISYGLPNRMHVTIKIYNLVGQVIRTLVDRQHEAGTFRVLWDGRNDLGKPVPSGVYLYQLRGEGFVATRKMIFLQ